MDDILKELGWGDGFRIPVANAENKALELELQQKQKEKENLKSNVEDVTERLSGMKKHFVNVLNQLDVNQNIIFAQTNQKNTEENLLKLAQIENSSLTNDIKRIKKEHGDIQERQKSVQSDINKILQHVEMLNETLKWDKDALLAWDEEMSKGDDDTLILEKFKKEDEAKFKELELKRQFLGTEVENKKNRLVGLRNDIISMEQSLDKTAQMFRRQHIERRVLVQQWEGSVRLLKQRDEDINRIADQIRNLKNVAKDRVKDLEEQKSFFENEEKNNIELEKENENLNKVTCDIREKIRLFEQIIFDESEKLQTLKTVLSTTSTQYAKERNLYKAITKEIEAKNDLVVEMKSRLEKAEKEFEKSKNKTVTAKERTVQLEQLLKEEEKIAEKNILEFKKLDELMHQVSQQITELKNGEKLQIFNIRHAESCKASMSKHILKTKGELNRQKEILYNMDFAYMEKDIQLNRLLNIIKDEDLEKHDERIVELEKIHSKLVATNNLLNKEVNRLEEDMRRLTKDIQGDTKEQNYLENKRQENILFLECGQKRLKNLRIQNQDKQVDINLLKLRVKQAEKAIDTIGDKVFCLEKQKLELEEVMKEREVEIKAMRDILNVRKRVLGEQAAGLNARVNLARVKLDHLKSKFEIETLKLGKDEYGEPMSLTQIKIKEAQERFELQEMGDKLDSKIKKTEKEILAMENTLRVVTASNKAFKNNLRSLDENSPEQKEKEELELTHSDLLSEYRKEKSFLESLEIITETLEKDYQEKLDTESSIISSWKEKDQQAAETDKEIKDQDEKLQRADKRLKKLIREIRGTAVPKFQTVEEKDIELRELMEQNEFGLQQLSELVAKTFDTGPVVMRYLTEKGIALPMIKSPGASGRSSTISTAISVGSSSTKTNCSVQSSSCLITPSVVSLDSTLFSGESKLKNCSKSSTNTGSNASCKHFSKKKEK